MNRKESPEKAKKCGNCGNVGYYQSECTCAVPSSSKIKPVGSRSIPAVEIPRSALQDMDEQNHKTDDSSVVSSFGKNERAGGDESLAHKAKPIEDTFAAGRYAWGGNTGNHGIQYESDLAFLLFVRASTLHQSEFKLATEMKVAGKFDDAVMFHKKSKEVWLFQAKHSSVEGKPISFNDLFPNALKANTDFSLVKYAQSYLDVMKKDEFKGFEKRFFIFTNKSLNNRDEKLKELLHIQECEVNPLLKFNGPECYVRFIPKEDKITALKEKMNLELLAIRDAIIELFNGGKVLDILVNYKTPLKSILVTSNDNLKFSDNFLNGKNGATQKWLFEEIKKINNARRKVDKATIKRIKKRSREFTAIKDAIIELFKTGNVPDILDKYKIFLESILVISDGYLKFSDDFLNSEKDVNQEYLFEELHQYFKNQQIKDAERKVDDKIEHLMKGSSRDTKLWNYSLPDNELADIRNAIIELFKTGNVPDILDNYNTLYGSLLVLSKDYLKFSDTFLNKKRDATQEWLFKELQQHFSIAIKDAERKVDQATKNLMQGNSRDIHLPKHSDDDSVREFFQHITFCVNQPSDLRKTVEESLRSWMRTWILPDDLGKYGAQLGLPLSKFEAEFKKWNKNTDAEKGYLVFEKGQTCVKEIIKQLMQDFRIKCSKEFERSYINREFMDCLDIMIDKNFIDQVTDPNVGNAFFLFIGEPGMGKTTLLQYIAFQVQKNSNVDVFLIYLNTLHKQLETMGDCKDFGTVYNILRSALSQTSLRTLENNLEKNTNQTIILLDGFDEIAFPDKVIALIKKLLSTENVQVIVSGRYHVKQKLEATFRVLAIRLVPLKTDEQMLFLKNYWKAADSQDFKIYSTQLLEKFFTGIPYYQYELFGLPLMIRMLAEVYADDFEKYLITDPENRRTDIFPQEKFNMVLLYEQFIKFSFDIKFKKKSFKDAYRNIEPSIDDEMDDLFKTFTIEHQMVAIEQLREDELKKIIISKANKKYNDLMTRIQKGTEKSPLFNVSYGELKFVHLSYAEFFVAKFIYDNINDCEANLFNILRTRETVRRFFFMLIEEKFSESSIQMNVLDKMCEEQSVVAFWACEASCVKTVTKLLQTHDLKTVIHEEYGTLLHAAAGAGCRSMVSFLLDYGIDVNSIGRIIHYLKNSHPSPLHIATEKGHFEIAKLLLDKSANMDIHDNDNMTPLHYACETGHHEIAQLLLGRSADVNHQDVTNKTPLHYASANGHEEIVKLLLDRSVDVNHQDVTNKTPLHYASANVHEEIVKLLLDRSADVNHQDVSNKTPLHYVCERYRGTGDLLPSKNSRLEIVKLLLDRSADVNHQDVSNKTPLHYAWKNGYEEIARLLRLSMRQ